MKQKGGEAAGRAGQSSSGAVGQGSGSAERHGIAGDRDGGTSVGLEQRSVLFAVKNHWLLSLMVAAVLLLASLLVRESLQLPWNLVLDPRAAAWCLGGLAAIAASDLLLYGLLDLAWRHWHRRNFAALITFFVPQRLPQIMAAGLLAGMEELFFRGAVLDWLLHGCRWPAMLAAAASALVFGLAHLIPSRLLWPFGLWAAWEGFLLGCIYLASGSLAVAITVHALHDMIGFALFACQRRAGRVPASVD